MSFLADWTNATWDMLVDSSVYFLVGLVLAGFIRAFFDEARIARLLGGRPASTVIKAAVMGIPLPLCSCSVLPVATQLRQSGLSRAGTTSFLISTPESGVDSILLTYSLTDPLMTVARPVAAFVSATAAGLIEVAVGENEVVEPLPQVVSCDCCSTHDDLSQQQAKDRRILNGLKHAFTVIIGDLAPYLLLGFVLAGLIGAWIGADSHAIPEALRSGWLAYLGALVVGLPLYICATSSTPLTAVMLATGISPGAILVFLLVGPATNLASLSVLKKILGAAATIRYLIVLTIIAVLCGIGLDWVYRTLDFAPSYMAGEAHAAAFRWLHVGSATILSILILWHSFRSWLRR